MQACHASDLILLDDTVGLGRTFDGVGGLSAGGISKLLMDYKEPQRTDILNYLFKPGFGASLHVLKVEIGGDAQAADATEASHMHNSSDLNYNRGFEWWLMKEAKSRNPDIKLYGLPWDFPGWVGNGTGNPYSDTSRLANYILKWVLGAKTHHGLDIDYVGIWNEKPYNISYMKILRKMLDDNGFEKTRIVAADGIDWTIMNDVMRDAELDSVVDVLGIHYPGTESPAAAVELGKPLWSSEDYSTYDNDAGGGCWARILNQNYVADAAFLALLPFFYAHTCQFSAPGWSYLRHGYGVGKLDGGGSIVSLVSPGASDLTIVIETMSQEHSKCIRPTLPSYNVTKQNITLQLMGSFVDVQELQVWYTKLQANSDVMNDSSNAPYFMAQQGVFEVVSVSDWEKHLRQTVLEMPIPWCPTTANLNATMNVIGNYKWADIYIRTEIMMVPVNGSDGVYIAARINSTGCQTYLARGLFFFLFPNDQLFLLTKDIAGNEIIKGGRNTALIDKTDNMLDLLVYKGYVSGKVNKGLLFNVSIPPDTPANGFVGLGTDSYGYADFEYFDISDPSNPTLYFSPESD
ncbi:hypothetical protein BaRGS_00000070 [Batillaria attramentaria]|uniref:Galactosylceramidase n=1 Tax=Batillaria attramentaria TaxID=370345 RepID=A0ABD0M9I5_9CAEN